MRIDPLARTLSVPQGTVLDLGATAKAHAADVTARLLLDRLPGGFLVNLGGDLAVSGPSPRGGWRVGVEALDGTVAEVVTTRTLCLATSSTIRRTWAAPDGHGIRHHIVDPRTGDTARTPWALVTCAAATTLEANTVATAAVVLGDEAPAWLEARGVVARLTDHAGRITTTRGWPSHREAVPA
ncbi:ApbE family lipoprotein (fragment) [Nostocoides japonicum T1-X7]|uniref:FAD:protein FMN transferase n=1 Tax=Nostocoides japonicum T1-X7 TaxID=1194083 RepID=A0A077M2A1_9MICO